MPLVSVILTSFNYGKYIREAIDSVLAQTFKDFELIIWDDASDDNSWEIINSYSDRRIKKFRNESRRRANWGVNKAISEIASGKYLADQHSKNSWEPDKLAKQVKFLDEHHGTGAVFTNALIIGEDGAPLSYASPFYSNIYDQTNRTRHEWLNFFLVQGNALCHTSVLIRKECYDNCGLYRLDIAQLPDLDMWMRLCLKYEIHVLPEKLTRYRLFSNETNTSGSRPDSRIRSTNEFYILLKNYLAIESFDELAAIFPEGAKYYRAGGFDFKFVFAMLLLEKETYIFEKLFAIDLLFEAMADPVRSQSIKALYDFDYQDLIKLTGKVDCFSTENLHAGLEAIKSTLSWRITHPLRVVKAVYNRITGS